PIEAAAPAWPCAGLQFSALRHAARRPLCAIVLSVDPTGRTLPSRALRGHRLGYRGSLDHRRLLTSVPRHPRGTEPHACRNDADPGPPSLLQLLDPSAEAMEVLLELPPPVLRGDRHRAPPDRDDDLDGAPYIIGLAGAGHGRTSTKTSGPREY